MDSKAILSRSLAQKPDLIIPAVPVAASSPPDGVSPLTRQYVVPPRPKPGRKPATDTPPTKRKAQNRAAQRAFRERRAAKVNELEDEMNEIRQEHEDEIAEIRKEYDAHLRDTDLFYKTTLKNMTDELASWRERYAKLEALLAEKQNNSISAEDAQKSYHTPPTVSDGCGNCTTESRCQCVEEAFEVNIAAEQKRPLSPNNDPELSKRPRTMEQNELETDFTNYNPPAQTTREQVMPSDSNNIEPCGFCSDGSACLCAEIAADNARSIDLPSIKQEGVPGTHSTCANGPGTCDTCKSNPTISVMCHSLNASQPRQLQLPTRESTKTAPCALGDACCRVSNTIANTQGRSKQNLNQVITGPTLSCADAFSALSQHQAFDKASKELGDWLPLLKTVPARSQVTHQEKQKTQVENTANANQLASNMTGRTGFEIEAASVLSVLQFYDTKYNAGNP